jgi:hypothetical protein
MLIERGRAPPMSDFEAALLQRMLAQEILAGSGIQPAIPVQSGSIDADPPKPVPGQVRLIYRQVPGPTPGSEPHSLLVLLNGYDKSFRYRVLMHSKGNVRPTDVCEVLPQVVGNEHWPYPIDQLDLTAVWLEAPEDGNIRCE